ncbi:hypothetical protein HELRODRAFT_102536 [Helobdella robusta]|uniref:PCIF1 WW domain-containing protein n=1 Tax=Helobdella robusta TaxID=6412 RepID=T1EDA2_HELRO|nr:hypothetical protein HELRODRAFT_102536 [Helobdella robusta]ESN95484.1 hypothetical protein HELRODRAFT_102536 [Helobdella robusta]
MRGLMVAKLRQNYQDLCSHREGIDAPMESFNRWLLERATVDKGIDPLLPSQCSVPLSSSMFREVINDVPIRLSRPRRCEDARRMLSKYAEAAKSLVMKRGCNVENRKTVAWHADDTFSFMQKRGNATYDDYMDRLAHLKRECQPHVIEAAKSSVEGICLKVYSLSCVYVKKIYDKHLSVLSAAGVDVKTLPGPTSSSSLLLPHSLTHHHHRYPCSPIALSTPLSPNVTVEHHDSGEVVTLRLKLAAAGVANNDVMKINSMHFRKLEQLYMLNCRDDPKMEHFLHRTWCLLKRYNTFFGTKENEGFGLQGALPVSVFQCLNRSFGVTFECFASPLNCYFKQFCSAFPDTDGYFGSRGSILDFYPISGSFEANPPFNEELMEAMVDHFESLLSETPLPLSFIIFLPDWKDPPTEALIKLESSRYKRQQMTIPAMEHEYRHGFQHICQRKDLNVRSLHGTLVIFLQNDAGANKWSVNNDNMRELLYAYQLNNNNNNNGPTN